MRNDKKLSYGVTLIAGMCLMLTCVMPARGQAAAFDPSGVYIDPAGVLQAKTIKAGLKLKLLQRKAMLGKQTGSLVFVSLPKVFREAKKLMSENKALPDDIKYLKGITRVRYVFVDEKTGDLLIGGPAEPIDKEMADRPIGSVTGRPVLQLDDLVVALRAAGPGSNKQGFGCTINLTNKHLNAMVETMNKGRLSIQEKPSLSRKLTEDMANAAGTQEVKFFALPANTRFSFVCVEADYLMKRLSLGLDKSPIPGMPSYLQLQKEIDLKGGRFWFEPNYESILTTEDRTGFEIKGQSIKLQTVARFTNRPQEPASPAAQKFAELTTRNFDRISKVVLSYADLANLSDLSMISAIIASEDLHKKASWDMSWVLDDRNGYPVAEVKTPKTAMTLCNYNKRGRMIMFVGGGVMLNPHEQIKQHKPKTTEGELPIVSGLPEDKWFLFPEVKEKRSSE